MSVYYNLLPGLSEPFDTTSGVRQGCVSAPVLFCIAMDWILNRCTESMGVTVGSTRFTDQVYADDGVLFTDCLSKWPEILITFDAAAETMGLHTSWQKTKIRNIGHGTPPSSVYMQISGQTVEAVDQFLYLAVLLIPMVDQCMKYIVEMVWCQITVTVQDRRMVTMDLL